MIPPLIPTTEEKDGAQRFIYRSAFPITVRITPKERIMDITLTDEPIRGKELSALLNVFGFSRNLEIGTEQTNTAHIIFRQRLLLLDMTRDSVVRYAEDTTGEDSRMCCRYYIDDTADELLPYIEEAEKSPLTEKLVAHLGKALVTKGEVRPTNMVPGIACNKKGTISTFPMVWGYTVPGGKGPVFNARSETAAEKPLFKDGWTTHRCVLPASYFFEWGIPAFDNDTGAKLSKAVPGLPLR